jgi:Putative rhamnosyl transferase
MRDAVSRRRSHRVVASCSSQEISIGTQNGTESCIHHLNPGMSTASSSARRIRRVRRFGASSEAAAGVFAKSGACLLSVGLGFVGICSLILVWNVHVKMSNTAEIDHIVLSADLFDHRMPMGFRGTKYIYRTLPGKNVLAPPTEWCNDRNLVHVIQTRFMQNQPHLLALGQARLELFRSLTVPSILHQTLPHFLWIVRTDPQLHPALREPLVAAIATVPNAVLVASNDNPEGWRDAQCIADITASSVWAGSLDLVRSYHAAAATHAVLETRCDADDAVAVDLVELVQTSATAGLTPLSSDWMVWCAENHLEWQYDSPWTSYQNDTRGKGALLALKAGHCITPGLTWGYTVNASRADIPVSQHHKIRQAVKPCGTWIGLNREALLSKCLVKLGGELYGRSIPVGAVARFETSMVAK